FALYLAKLRGTANADQLREIGLALRDLPSLVDQALNVNEDAVAVARRHAKATSVLFLGRHVNYPIALEGALKLKEISYIHAEGYAAGEMKHGAIGMPD